MVLNFSLTTVVFTISHVLILLQHSSMCIVDTRAISNCPIILPPRRGSIWFSYYFKFDFPINGPGRISDTIIQFILSALLRRPTL